MKCQICDDKGFWIDEIGTWSCWHCGLEIKPIFKNMIKKKQICGLVKGTLEYELAHDQRFMFMLGFISGVFIVLLLVSAYINL